MSVSLRSSIEDIADPRGLDASVQEVFRLILGIDCFPALSPIAQPAESIAAVVGFGGVLSGACIFRVGTDAAIRMAARMTGTSLDRLDETVMDGVAELCNMIAGAWKARIHGLAARCALSLPTVIAGRDYNLHVQSPRFRLQQSYRCEDLCFDATIVCDALE